MTPDLPADHLSALAREDPYAFDLLHAQLDEIAGQGRWSYQLTVTGATFAPVIHVTADWQLVEYHYADRPLRYELATGRALGATVSDALTPLSHRSAPPSRSRTRSMSSSNPPLSVADGRAPRGRFRCPGTTDAGRRP